MGSGVFGWLHRERAKLERGVESACSISSLEHVRMWVRRAKNTFPMFSRLCLDRHLFFRSRETAQLKCIVVFAGWSLLGRAFGNAMFALASSPVIVQSYASAYNQLLKDSV